jgi:hypothetical protein
MWPQRRGALRLGLTERDRIELARILNVVFIMTLSCPQPEPGRICVCRLRRLELSHVSWSEMTDERTSYVSSLYYLGLDYLSPSLTLHLPTSRYISRVSGAPEIDIW